MSLKISVVIITFNEEENIERCISSVKDIADEILVVDSFSTDTTKSICEDLGVRFEQSKFLGHIEQKNYAKNLASNNYVLSMDADEALSEELKNNILSLNSDELADGYSMNRRNNYCGQWIYHSDWYPDKKLRLWHKNKGDWGGINPHDKFIMNKDTSISHLAGDLLHYTVKSPAQHLEQTIKFGNIGAEMHKSSSLLYLLIKTVLSPPMRMLKMFILKKGFLDGMAGWKISSMTSYEVWLKYSGAIKRKFAK